MYDILELNKKLASELREIGKQLQIKRVDSLKKQDLVYKILDQQAITATEGKRTEKRRPGRRGKIQTAKVDKDTFITDKPEIKGTEITALPSLPSQKSTTEE
nr:transcription termination factor Rho [Bacteroidota bacterium]